MEGQYPDQPLVAQFLPPTRQLQGTAACSLVYVPVVTRESILMPLVLLRSKSWWVVASPPRPYCPRPGTHMRPVPRRSRALEPHPELGAIRICPASRDFFSVHSR